MPEYFGFRGAVNREVNRVQTPVGSLCAWCDEVIRMNDKGVAFEGPTYEHMECYVRSLVGSVDRQKGIYLPPGDDEGEAGMTKREAAIRAYEYFQGKANSERDDRVVEYLEKVGWVEHVTNPNERRTSEH